MKDFLRRIRALRAALDRPLRGLGAGVLAAGLAGAGAAWSGPLPQPPSGPEFGPSRPGLLHRVAVFGTDDRMALPADKAALRRSIGLIYEGRSHSVCTAFCVGDDMIATAGHCLFRTAGERPLRLKGVEFRLQPHDGPALSSRIAGSEHNGEAQHVAAGSLELRVRPPIDAAQDWALIRIRKPICKGHALPISRQPARALIKLSAAQRVYQVSYHRDFGAWELALGAPCAIRRSFGGADWRAIAKDFVDADHVILHTCDTGGASSGSPMLIDGPKGPEVVGINVGTYLQARVLTQKGEVVHRYKSETVANTAVGAAAFRPALDALARAEILASRDDVIVLQRLLKVEGHYRGTPDGVYGPLLNAAVRAFERAEGRGQTGLATVALLKRLAARDAERRGTPGTPRPTQIETGSVGSHTTTRGNARLPR
ncbi:peptidoglycan-binding protein [Hyphomicrobium sp.]|uniref:peptidoglycan-binding protein n=1 Tax=Hyphomicrobium sp. TaxID=82 RepID=UPI0025BCBB29|nr:peptidoglycan-binding protein [Hyphomicrobium sp.]MCC7251018.1 peptidoglycan-binding protein [Hyphomicrobium sp.]